MSHTSTPTTQATDESIHGRYLEIINAAREHGASDIHIRAVGPAFFRAAGKMTALPQPRFSADELLRLIEITSRRDVRSFPPSVGAFEYSFEQRDVFRLRCHAFRELAGWALAIRLVPLQLPGFADLRLPPVVKQLAEPRPGMVIVAGPTGSGKSTTCAAMLEYLAANASVHMVTVEDPIEHRIHPMSSLVSQREVGLHTSSFAEGFRAAMREDPDVLFVGEMRDRDSLEAAINAADTGHMVLTTFHTPTALHTIRRLIGSYASDEQANVRERLADALRGIICQRLVPRAQGLGRVLATEVLVNNYSVKEYVRDAVKLRGLEQLMERSNDQNMHTIDQSLIQLTRAKLVDPTVALAFASSPTNMRRALSLSA